MFSVTEFFNVMSAILRRMVKLFTEHPVVTIGCSVAAVVSATYAVIRSADEGRFIPRTEVESQYISRAQLSDNYLSKEYVDGEYVRRSSWEAEQNKNAVLAEKLTVIPSLDDHIRSLMKDGDHARQTIVDLRASVKALRIILDDNGRAITELKQKVAASARIIELRKERAAVRQQLIDAEGKLLDISTQAAIAEADAQVNAKNDGSTVSYSRSTPETDYLVGRAQMSITKEARQRLIDEFKTLSEEIAKELDILRRYGEAIEPISIPATEDAAVLSNL